MPTNKSQDQLLNSGYKVDTEPAILFEAHKLADYERSRLVSRLTP